MSDMRNVDRFHRAARQVGVTAATGCGLEGLLLGNPPGVRSKPSAYGGPADAVQGGGGGGCRAHPGESPCSFFGTPISPYMTKLNDSRAPRGGAVVKVLHAASPTQ